MAFPFPKSSGEAESEVREQLGRLQREIAALTKVLSKSGSAAVAETRDSAYELYEDVWERVAAALPGWKKQARGVGKVVRDHPTATVATVGLVVAGLLVALLVARRSDD